MIKQLGILVITSAFLISGCGSMDRSDAGAGLGAVVGGVVGNQFGQGSGNVAATIFGAAVGAYLGSRIGTSMDNGDQRHVGHALEHNRSGQTASWVNPDTGNHYAVTPAPAYRTSSGQYCRNFQQSGVIDGQKQLLKGTACRQHDGSWEVVSAR